MALNQRPDRGKLNLVVLADGFGSKIARQAGAAAKALVWMMIDDAIGILMSMGTEVSAKVGIQFSLSGG